MREARLSVSPTRGPAQQEAGCGILGVRGGGPSFRHLLSSSAVGPPLHPLCAIGGGGAQRGGEVRLIGGEVSGSHARPKRPIPPHPAEYRPPPPSTAENSRKPPNGALRHPPPPSTALHRLPPNGALHRPPPPPTAKNRPPLHSTAERRRTAPNGAARCPPPLNPRQGC